MPRLDVAASRPLRLATFVAAVLLVVLVASCSPSGGGGGGGSGGTGAELSITGSVIGYPYVGAATLQAFAPEDGAQLASGTLFPAPNSRVNGSFTSPNLVPLSSFVNPYFCNAAVASPANLLTTGVLLTGVADTGGVFGFLIRASFATPFGGATPGDRAFVYILASTNGQVTGSCVMDGINYTYSINLVRGWNSVAGRIDAIDSLGNPVAVTYLTQSPSSGHAWYYADLSMLTASGTEPNVASAVLQGLRLGD